MSVGLTQIAVSLNIKLWESIFLLRSASLVKFLINSFVCFQLICINYFLEGYQQLLLSVCMTIRSQSQSGTAVCERLQDCWDDKTEQLSDTSPCQLLAPPPAGLTENCLCRETTGFQRTDRQKYTQAEWDYEELLRDFRKKNGVSSSLTLSQNNITWRSGSVVTMCQAYRYVCPRQLMKQTLMSKETIKLKDECRSSGESYSSASFPYSRNDQ